MLDNSKLLFLLKHSSRKENGGYSGDVTGMFVV